MGEKREIRIHRGMFFEEYEVGQTIKSSGRTITEADIVAFAGLTGDWNPLHTDAVFAAQHPLGQRVAHGVLALSIAVALAARMGFLEETLLAFREIGSWKFSLPLFIGDTIHMRAEVTRIHPVPRLHAGMVTLAVEVVNQREEIIQSGTWSVLIGSVEGQPGGE